MGTPLALAFRDMVAFHRGGVIGARAAQMLRRTTYDRARSPCDNGPVNAEPKLDLASADTLATESVCARLDSTPQGLSAAEASVRLAVSGPNALRVRRVTALGVLACGSCATRC